MPISQDTLPTNNSIQAFDKKSIRIDNKLYSQTILVTKEGVFPFNRKKFSALTQADCQLIAKTHQMDFFLIGAGKDYQTTQDEIFTPFYKQNTSVEVMRSQAAVNTLMALTAEGRSVVSLIFMETDA